MVRSVTCELREPCVPSRRLIDSDSLSCEPSESQVRMAKTAHLLVLGSFLVSSLLIVWNVAGYFLEGARPSFFEERSELTAGTAWRAAFYYHISGAAVCLPAGFLLMFPGLLRVSRRLHHILGLAYVVSVCCVSAPGGFYLAWFAKGGAAGVVGFLVLSVAWFLSTWLGLQSIRQGRLEAHIQWMIRSYCLALTAVTFRWIQITLYFLGVADELNYVASLWLSLAGAVLMSETRCGLFPFRLGIPLRRAPLSRFLPRLASLLSRRPAEWKGLP